MQPGASGKAGRKVILGPINALTEHFESTLSEIVQQFKYHIRFCQQGESVALYVAELRSLAEYCNFGNQLEMMLCDCIDSESLHSLSVRVRPIVEVPRQEMCMS